MVDSTARDHVWAAAIELLIDRQEFRTRDIANQLDDDASLPTIRRTLRAMEELDWIEREAPESHYWRAGPKAHEHLDT